MNDKCNTPLLEINLVNLLSSLSISLDFSNRGISKHHHRVALIALEIGRQANLSAAELVELFKAAIIHDIGAVTWKEKLKLAQFDVESPWDHCQKGAALLTGVPDLETISPILESHHDHWEGGNRSGLSKSDIPLASRIIHLADRVDVLIKPECFILEQRNDILHTIQAQAGKIFDPYLVDMLNGQASRDSFWLDLTSPWTDQRLLELLPDTGNYILCNFLTLARLFGRVVDCKSPFTYRHSIYTGSTARVLAEAAHLTEENCFLVEAAALLHDIGKLAVSEAIIEKPGRLSEAEFIQVRQHAYHTYWLLKQVAPGLPIAKWAAYHHERLDGTGYPFGLKGQQLDCEAKIVAIADLFTALRENRPYRSGLAWPEIENIIRKQADSGTVDSDLTVLLIQNRDRLDHIWQEISNTKV
jgi:HD-GYP domain-containing protein (c-di-GMP phosphodiesterase class II)